MKKIFSFIVSVMVLLSFTSKQTNCRLVIISHGNSNNLTFTYPSGTSVHSTSKDVFSYITDKNEIVGWSPIAESDTLVIISKYDNIEIALIFKAIEKRFYLFQVGDTIDIYNDSIPLIHSRLNPELDSLYNLNNNLNKKFNTPFHLHPLTILNENYFEAVYRAKEALPEMYQKRKTEYFDRDTLMMLFNSYINNCDSIVNNYKSNSTNSWLLDYIKQQNTYQAFKFNRIIGDTSTSIYSYFDDLLMSRISYIDFLRTCNLHRDKAITNDIESIKNQNLVDQKKLYSLIKNDDKLTKLTRNYLLYLTLHDLISYNGTTIADIKYYMDDYLQFTRDSAMVKSLKDEYNIDFSKSYQLALIDTDETKTDFNTLLNQFKGKVIYVDFWGSRCAPCRRAMPSAYMLRNDYKNKDIVFIYLALGDKSTDWKKAVEEEKTNWNGYNYLVDNPKTSAMLKELQIQAIPRYLLFDKKGDLIYKNAPGPTDINTRSILDKLINEK